MRELAAVGALGVTLSLVISRPHIGAGDLRVGPALSVAAGVLIMVITGFLGFGDIGTALETLWRPILAITSIMITTAAALRLGVIDGVAQAVFPRARGSAARLFPLVFFLSAAVSAVLNNDAAVLLLTPLVITLVRGLYPDHDELMIPFAFAVFMAAGVAPLVTANPMNLIVADYAGLDFNDYAVRMLPISLVGWVVTYSMLRWIFRKELEAVPDAEAPPSTERIRWTRAQRQGLALVLTVLGSYPIVSYFGGSVWIVAVSGAVVGIALCVMHRVGDPQEVVVKGVSWEILVFLLGVFVLALGLRNAGVVDWLSSLYEGSSEVVIGGVSAIGSALINNHSMALTNLLAIDATPGTGQHDYLAALIGGDLGPRLLPMGSLAGLLWLASLRTLDVEIPLRRFMTIGVAVTIPSLAVSLGLLSLI